MAEITWCPRCGKRMVKEVPLEPWGCTDCGYVQTGQPSPVRASAPAIRVDSLPYPDQIAYWRRDVRSIFIRLGLLSGDDDLMPSSQHIREAATRLERDPQTYADGVELRTADATILWLEAAIADQR